MNFENFTFYKDRVAVNLLAKDIDNAADVVNVLDGAGVIGVLSKDFNSVEDAVKYIKEMKKRIPVVSVGLGNGDPKQWKMAAEIGAETDPGHINQVFSTAGYTLGLLKGKGCEKTLVNALISPAGEGGKVMISTGPFSSQERTIIDIDEALKILKDAGVESVKFFNLKNMKNLDELREVAKSCVKNGIPVIEPTGGIDAANIHDIVKICIEAGCEKVIPHVYSSAIDKNTGLTDVDIVNKIYGEIKRVF